MAIPSINGYPIQVYLYGYCSGIEILRQISSLSSVSISGSSFRYSIQITSD